MTLTITFVRHARSEANVAEIWQGQGDSPLAPEGVEQARKLGDRLSTTPFDLVVSSDLSRTEATALAVSEDVVLDPAWREMNLGEWEGQTFEAVRSAHPDLLRAIREGEDIPFGGSGETFRDFEARIEDAFGSLIDRVGEGSVLVVTHGGVIDALVGSRLGRVPGRRTHPIATNTSLTRFVIGDGRTAPERLQLTTFNDASHLGRDVGFLGRAREDGVGVVGFVRHGVTGANKEHRIQGQTCWGLDDEGRLQATRFAEWYGPVDRVITSPLLRARETAELVANGRPPVLDPRVQEMAFGEWEGLAFHELMASGDELARRVFRDREDLPRGESGESFRMLVGRLSGFLDDLRPDPAERTLVVSHGAAIRAVAAVIGGHEDMWSGLGTSPNTGVTHVAWTDEGPMIADYGVAPHLDVELGGRPSQGA